MRKITLRQRYEKGISDRESALHKARVASKITIPSLIPEDDNAKNQVFVEPNQSVGANGVNYLASKIAMTMLPPNSPFFRYVGDTIRLKNEAELAGYDPQQYEQDFNKNLSLLAEYIKDSIEESGDRVVVGEAMKHNIVAGNVFLVDDKEKNLKYYPLSRYIVKRDYFGNVLEAVTKETIGFLALEKDIQDKIKGKYYSEKDFETKEYPIYTGFLRSKKKNGSEYEWEIYQEVEEITIESTKGFYPIEKPPFLALRWTAIAGENYGRGLIEEVIGDMRALDDISKAITEGAKASARIITLVNPAGTTRLKTLHNAKNGAIISGRKEDITFAQTEKYHDLNTAQHREQELERRLSKIFLTADGVTRDAERVTAYEVQYLATKLEEALGNTYSLLLQTFQKTYLNIKYHHLRIKNKDLPDITKGEGIKLIITTGIDALGRNNEALKKDLFFQKISQLAQVVQPLGLDIQVVAQSYANDLGLNIENYFKTEERQQQEQTDALNQQTMADLAPELLRQAGGMMQNQQKEQLAQEPQ